MYPFKRILVGLDLSGRERATMEYALKAVEMTKPRRITFVHVACRSDILDEHILEKHPELMERLDADALIEEMKELVGESFKESEGPEMVYDVVRGDPLDTLVQYAVDKDIDLMIVGSKSGNRVLPERIARNAHCSILVVPEGSRFEKFRILVPLDFSELCAEAMKVALSCYRVGSGEYMLCQHVYRVPDGYHKLGKTRAQFTNIMQDHGRRDHAKFIQGFEMDGVDPETIFTRDADIARAIIQAVKDNNINLVIIGARGRTGASAFILGSVTEKLIRNCFVPVLAVKKKGANLGFLQAMIEQG